MSLKSGTQIGPYTIAGEVGRGGMGVVYRAIDERLDRVVAIKALPEELASDSGRLERFEREARVLASLNHPNVAGIHGIEEQDGAKYLVLEFVDGETLAEVLDRGPIDVDDAIELAVQIAAGVEAAHEAGVIHRDLKPANIKVTPEGVAKVLDFGLAKADEGSVSGTGSGFSQSPTMTTPVGGMGGQHSPTMEGAILGTAAYMSPEQARGRKVDKRTDIWSFGVVLYEMLCGASPFYGETATDSIGAVLHKDLDFDRLPAGTPSGVRRVLSRCVERDKSLRYRDIGDVRVELLAAPSQDEAGKSVATKRTSVLTLAAVGLITLVLGVVVGRSLLSKAEPRLTMRIALPVNMVEPLDGSSTPLFDLDPSGTRIAYIGVDPDDDAEDPVQSVYLRDLYSGESTRVSGTEHAQRVSFSPSGDQLAFSWKEPGRTQWELRRVGVEGGGALTIFEDPKSFNLEKRPVWVGEDQLAVRGNDRTSFYVVESAGGMPRLVADLAEQIPGLIFSLDHWSPPSGEYLYISGYVDHEEGNRSSIYELDLATKQLRVIVERGWMFRVMDSGHAVFYRDDSLCAALWDPKSRSLNGPVVAVAPSDSDEGTSAISAGGTLAYTSPSAGSDTGRVMSVDRNGLMEPVTEFSREFNGHVRLSPDGARLLLTMDAQVHVLDVQTAYLRPVTSDGISILPEWMPDGTVVYNRFESMMVQRYMIASGSMGESAMPVIEGEAGEGLRGEISFSTDGEIAIVSRGVQGTDEADLYAIDLKDNSAHPLIASPNDTRNAELSPDTRLIAYLTNDTGEIRVTLRTFDRETFTVGQSPVAVSLQVSKGPLWSSDGKELFWVGLEDEALMVADVRYETGESGGEPVLTVSEPRVVFSRADVPFFMDYSDRPFDLTNDGQRFYYIEQRDALQTPPHVNLVLNFDVELNRLVPLN